MPDIVCILRSSSPWLSCLDFDLYTGTVLPNRYIRDNFMLATMLFSLRLSHSGGERLWSPGITFSMCFNFYFTTHGSPVSNVICGDERGECGGGMPFPPLLFISSLLFVGNPEVFCIYSEELVHSKFWLYRRWKFILNWSLLKMPTALYLSTKGTRADLFWHWCHWQFCCCVGSRSFPFVWFSSIPNTVTAEGLQIFNHNPLLFIKGKLLSFPICFRKNTKDIFKRLFFYCLKI